MKRVIALFLSAAMLLIFAACNLSQKETEETAPPATRNVDSETDEPEPDSLEARKLIPDDLPEKDFQGAAYRISAMKSRQYEAYSESENGDVCNDAVYARNRSVEERFKATIETTLIEDAAYVASVTETILAADDLYDVSTMNTYLANSLIAQGLYKNWLGTPHVSFEKPWWNTKAIDSYTVNDRCYVVIGSFNLTMLLRTYAIFFNQQLVRDYNIGDIYQTVNDGQWTIDKIDAITKEIYSDLDGDGQRGEKDLYGFTSDTQNCLDVFMPASNIPIFKREDGYPVLCLNVDKTSTLFDKVYKLYYDNTGSCISSDSNLLISMFSEGQSVFYITWLDNAFKTFRFMDNDYGIVPFVKYDEAQEEYLTTSMDNVSALTLPQTSSNLDLAGIITEALYAESYKNVMPAYYDVALKTKFTRDEQSVSMLDTVMNGITYDFAFLHYQSLMGITQVFRRLIGDKSKTFVSYYAENESALQANLDKLIDIYKGL
ncbi:MAG: hypothetical protein GX628_11105 [Clostridiales bacterium]|nr:hypothetical protein [Clostridiales bacterium]